jgi:hypothetical protein
VRPESGYAEGLHSVTSGVHYVLFTSDVFFAKVLCVSCQAAAERKLAAALSNGMLRSPVGAA